MRLGECFFTPDVPGVVNRHLWVIVSDPEASDKVAIANLSTRPEMNTEGCAIRPGEHPSVSSKSYVRCESARVVSVARLEQLAARLSPTRDATRTFLTKVQDALLGCRLAPREVRNLILSQRRESASGESQEE